MNEAKLTYGRQAAGTANPCALLDLERAHQRGDRFTAIDTLTGHLLVRALQGERISALTRDALGVTRVALIGLSERELTLVHNLFAIEHQQARGAWFLPKEASLKNGFINLPALVRTYGRFFEDSLFDERGTVAFEGASEAVFLWSIIDPMLTTLLLPFDLRSRYAGVKGREDQLKVWKEVDALTDALNLDLDEVYGIMRYSGGWHKLTAHEQFAVKQRVVDAIASQATPELAARYRAFRLHALLTNYYKKAKEDGRVKRKQALTKALERTVAAYFGGDWLAVLDYLGELPHPDEQVITALPEPRLFIGDSTRVADIATAQGLPIEEVQRMLAAFWQQDHVVSPVEQRVAVLTQYWQAFETIHAYQDVGMAPLWGLVEDSFQHLSFDGTDTFPYMPELYRALLPSNLIGDIERLWGTSMFPRWPERMVTQPFPHGAMAQAFGPVLQFWHGCALTAWFICEGPLSRTDLPGMEHYYRRELAALDAMQVPVDRQLFAELIAAEAHLGKSQSIERRSSSFSNVGGITIRTSTFAGARRDGFPMLRDIISRHRQAWADHYLQRYLRTRWEDALGDASNAYHQALNTKGTPPTLKQFARAAAPATNDWFGGDMSGLYTALGVQLKTSPIYERQMPHDIKAFAYTVFRRLGGQRKQEERPSPIDREVYQSWIADSQRQRQLSVLARESLFYVQLEEALGRQPTLKEFGNDKFTYPASAVSDDSEVAWRQFGLAIQQAKQKPLVLPKRFQSAIPLSYQTPLAPVLIHPADKEQQEPSSVTPTVLLLPTTVAEQAHNSNNGDPEEQHGRSNEEEIPSMSSSTSVPDAVVATMPQPLKSDSIPDAPPLPKKRSWLDRLLGRNKA